MIEHGVSFCDKILEGGTCDRTACRDCEFWKRDHAVSNADRIRSMTDEELAEFLETVNSCSCSFVMGKSPCVADGCPCWFEWLREEVSE